MKTLQLDTVTNDLVIVNGNLVVIEGTAQIQQKIQTTLQLFLGEWFLDTTQGIPYRQTILVKNPNLAVIQATLMNAILAVPGVDDILTFVYGYVKATRQLTITVQVRTTNGQSITAQAQIGPGGAT